ncbi:uncharacterized protein A4U43_C03F3570 [Asparagus officinalis]|uniref:Uncharacterized protein n=1 Tax=Asparagus officinalis TaxID=4686 RepID=A0A5P1F7S5_ASPOF|nr:cyclin-D4-1-like [Asparagus officinalis]ONK74174.1 uncharacterized protein A4U43_C03F3570 [Asparagus officinalis]
MGLSYETASSILLCAEDNNSILCFEDELEEDVWAPQQQRSDLYEDFLMGFPLQSDECLDLMIKTEAEHLPREDYGKRLITGALDLSIRRDAIDWIWKAHAHYSFGPLSAYLSVNYLDRFLSAYELPQGKTWMSQLLSVACLSLAAKMEETEVPLLLDLQVSESKYVFEARTIQRMELLVLSTLKWRMQAVTPFSFIDYFLHKFNDGNSPSKPLISRAAQLILSTARGIEFLAFRPSEIAAAVAMSVLGETQMVDIEKFASFCNNVDKAKLLRCYEVIQEVIFMKSMGLKNASSPSSSSALSPTGVLDAGCCLSHNSEERATDTHENSHNSSPASKRRKISRHFVS